ncbi:MAG: 30S ribosomal protein S17 [Saprospiraceae bacterium]|nr:30S ribosomal protein S17 [Bacteroidia bacterium]NNE16047.1 30S ribosomal protein S17 [Saprospiraceae bacterium]NNL91268.1 30S ribosomal protein S17 [Saprospiraceae bacterium]
MSTIEKTETNKKQRIGVVTSTKMDKTITISVERKIKHPIYGKFVKKTKKFVAHDEKNDCNEGDIVKIIESRPLSKRKRWRLVEIIERAK